MVKTMATAPTSNRKTKVAGHIATLFALSVGSCTVFKVEKITILDKIAENFVINGFTVFGRSRAPAGNLMSISVTVPSSDKSTITYETVQLHFECGDQQGARNRISKFPIGKADTLLDGADIKTAVEKIAARLPHPAENKQLVGIVLIGSADKLPTHNTQLGDKVGNDKLALDRAASVQELLQKAPALEPWSKRLWYWTINNSAPDIRLLGSGEVASFDTVRAVDVCGAYRIVDPDSAKNETRE